MITQTPSIRLDALPSVSVAEKARLPDCPGVYVVSRHGNVLYVGRSETSLRVRWFDHHKRRSLELDDRISWIEESTDVRRLEHSLIKQFCPSLNNQRTKKSPSIYKQVGAAMLTPEVEAVVIKLARAEERSVTFMIRRLIEESPRVKSALKNGRKAK